MPKTISEIMEEFDEDWEIFFDELGAYGCFEDIKSFIRTAIQTAFDSTRGGRETENDVDDLESSCIKQGQNLALAEQKEREDKFMKGEV